MTRPVRALTDVVAVEEHAPGMARVVTWSDAYVIDARGAGCNCPDKEYHDAPMCKHEYAAVLFDTDYLPAPYVTEIDERETCPDCEALPEGWACWGCVETGDAEVPA